MDTRTTNQDGKAEVAAKIDQIKQHMPEVYKCIKAKAGEIGNQAFELVRRGLRGEANCFYAFEAGHVVGTPFTLTEVSRDIAQYMVTFGCVHVCIFQAAVLSEVEHGAH